MGIEDKMQLWFVMHGDVTLKLTDKFMWKLTVGNTNDVPLGEISGKYVVEAATVAECIAAMDELLEADQ